jgi:hypothetical protein
MHCGTYRPEILLFQLRRNPILVVVTLYVYSDGGIATIIPAARGRDTYIHVNFNAQKIRVYPLFQRYIHTLTSLSHHRIPPLSISKGKNGLLFLSDTGGRKYRQSPSISSSRR